MSNYYDKESLIMFINTLPDNLQAEISETTKWIDIEINKEVFND